MSNNLDKKLEEKNLFCEYRDHLCFIGEEFDNDEVTLRLVGEYLVGGGVVECDCAREQFAMVQVSQDERFGISRLNEEWEHQAIKDGWVDYSKFKEANDALNSAPVPTEDRTVAFLIPDGYMTGKEFYDRFEKEYWTNEDYKDIPMDILKAALKASGKS